MRCLFVSRGCGRVAAIRRRPALAWLGRLPGRRRRSACRGPRGPAASPCCVHVAASNGSPGAVQRRSAAGLRPVLPRSAGPANAGRPGRQRASARIRCIRCSGQRLGLRPMLSPSGGRQGRVWSVCHRDAPAQVPACGFAVPGRAGSRRQASQRRGPLASGAGGWARALASNRRVWAPSDRLPPQRAPGVRREPWSLHPHGRNEGGAERAGFQGVRGCPARDQVQGEALVAGAVRDVPAAAPVRRGRIPRTDASGDAPPGRCLPRCGACRRQAPRGLRRPGGDTGAWPVPRLLRVPGARSGAVAHPRSC
mmetsp:Transcript_20264/g.77799  ORF Transcript_20264/g.77799 Transcript_20264/m.77799 type:complete len:309 (+) Transcript_20264:573-1499(+)